MTTELEKDFFKAFGIEPKYQDACTVEDKYWQNEELANKYGTFDMYMNAKCGNQENCSTQCSCAYTKEIYPEITAEKIIQIFLVLNQWYDWRYNVDIEAENIDDFKKEVLQKCIDTYNRGWVAYDGFEPKNTGLYKGIQQLFKGEE